MPETNIGACGCCCKKCGDCKKVPFAWNLNSTISGFSATCGDCEFGLTGNYVLDYEGGCTWGNNAGLDPGAPRFVLSGGATWTLSASFGCASITLDLEFTSAGCSSLGPADNTVDTPACGTMFVGGTSLQAEFGPCVPAGAA